MTMQTALRPDPSGIVRATISGSGETAALTGVAAGNAWRVYTDVAGMRMITGSTGVSAANGWTLMAGVAEVFVIPQGAVAAFAGTGTVELTRMVAL